MGRFLVSALVMCYLLLFTDAALNPGALRTGGISNKLKHAISGSGGHLTVTGKTSGKELGPINEAGMASELVLKNTLLHLADDVVLNLILRSVDFNFFVNNWASAKAQRKKALNPRKVTLTPHVASSPTPLAGGYKLYERFVSGDASLLHTRGGETAVFTFKDLPADVLFAAYLNVLNLVKSGGDLETTLKQDAQKLLANDIKATQEGANKLIAYNSPSARALRAVTKSFLALAMPATLGILYVAVDAADEALVMELTKTSRANLKAKAQMLLGALFLLERSIQSSTTCSIVAGGCGADEFCKREFVFQTLPLTSLNGYCAPLHKQQFGPGAGCLLHSDCTTGYCSYGYLQADGGKTFVSARYAIARGDEDVDADRQVVLTPEQRLIALSGICMQVSSSQSGGCRVITNQHSFYECP